MLIRTLRLSFTLFLALTYAFPTGKVFSILNMGNPTPVTRREPKRKGLLVPARTVANSADCQQRWRPVEPTCSSHEQVCFAYSFYCTDAPSKIVVPPPRLNRA